MAAAPVCLRLTVPSGQRAMRRGNPRVRRVLVGARRLAEVKLMAELGFELGGFGESGATALHAAAWHGHPAMAELLVSFRAPVNIRDATHGASPLAWAAHGSRNCRDADCDYCAIIDTLFDAGADYAASINRWGIQPEEIASGPVAALIRSRVL